MGGRSESKMFHDWVWHIARRLEELMAAGGWTEEQKDEVRDNLRDGLIGPGYRHAKKYWTEKQAEGIAANIFGLYDRQHKIFEAARVWDTEAINRVWGEMRPDEQIVMIEAYRNAIDEGIQIAVEPTRPSKRQPEPAEILKFPVAKNRHRRPQD